MDRMHDGKCKEFEEFLKLYLNLRLAADYLCRGESMGNSMVMLTKLSMFVPALPHKH